MSLNLNIEYKTTVEGDGQGFICITQIDEHGETRAVYLSTHQFEIIVEEKEHLVLEALGVE